MDSKLKLEEEIMENEPELFGKGENQQESLQESFQEEIREESQPALEQEGNNVWQLVGNEEIEEAKRADEEDKKNKRLKRMRSVGRDKLKTMNLDETMDWIEERLKDGDDRKTFGPIVDAFRELQVFANKVKQEGLAVGDNSQFYILMTRLGNAAGTYRSTHRSTVFSTKGKDRKAICDTIVSDRFFDMVAGELGIGSNNQENEVTANSNTAEEKNRAGKNEAANELISVVRDNSSMLPGDFLNNNSFLMALEKYILRDDLASSQNLTRAEFLSNGKGIERAEMGQRIAMELEQIKNTSETIAMDVINLLGWSAARDEVLDIYRELIGRKILEMRMGDVEISADGKNQKLGENKAISENLRIDNKLNKIKRTTESSEPNAQSRTISNAGYTAEEIQRLKLKAQAKIDERWTGEERQGVTELQDPRKVWDYILDTEYLSLEDPSQYWRNISTILELMAEEEHKKEYFDEKTILARENDAVNPLKLAAQKNGVLLTFIDNLNISFRNRTGVDLKRAVQVENFGTEKAEDRGERENAESSRKFEQKRNELMKSIISTDKSAGAQDTIKSMINEANSFEEIEVIRRLGLYEDIYIDESLLKSRLAELESLQI